MLNKQTVTKRGFTIIELMAVVVIISVGIVGVSNVIAQTFSQGRFITEKLTAAYLAQEGIEIVRNIRDTNWLQEVNWDAGIDVGDRQADYNDSLSPYSDSFLQLDGGFYNYGSGNNTKFKRKINIQKPGNEILVTVTVYWDNFQVKAMEKLYDWR